jgi:hypothetical protein
LWTLLFLLLHNKKNLSVHKEDIQAALARAFSHIRIVWQFKEYLRTWYATASSSNVTTGLNTWIAAI